VAAVPVDDAVEVFPRLVGREVEHRFIAGVRDSVRAYIGVYRRAVVGPVRERVVVVVGLGAAVVVVEAVEVLAHVAAFHRAAQGRLPQVAALV
jgi:hypothetical protein